MEINARVYAVSTDENLLKQVHRVLSAKTFQHHVFIDPLEPCAVLPLSRTWYGFAERAEPTNGPKDWLETLRECAGLLRQNGAVVVEYFSPDAPDDDREYAWTTPSGGAGSGSRPGIIGYARSAGPDLSLALDELFSGRTARDRMFASRRKEKQEALRKAKGDFEITPDGILKKYRGHDPEVVIPDGVREIGESAFVDLKGVERMIMECGDYDAPEMTELTIPDSVEKIQSYAFAYCQNLTTVNISNSVVSIGDRAFEGCEALTKIHLPGHLEEIEEYTFFLCWDLKSIEIPENVKHIREGAFNGCSLSRISLPEGLETVGKEAFRGCRLKKVRIPKSVKEIGEDAFPRETEIIREE